MVKDENASNRGGTPRKTGDKMRFFGVIVVILALFAGVRPAHAQLIMPEDPLTRDIRVYQYSVDPASGEARVVDQWQWLDYARYYDLLMRFPAVGFVPEGVARRLPTDPSQLLIVEKSRGGDTLRQIIVSNNTVKVTTFATSTRDFSDVDNIYDILRKATALRAEKPIWPGDKNGIIQVKSNINRVNVIWNMNDQREVDGLWAMIDKMPAISGFDSNKSHNDFNNLDAIYLMIPDPKPGRPNQVIFDNLQARLVYIDPLTQIYKDQINFKTYALGQKELAKFYEERSVKPAPKTY